MKLIIEGAPEEIKERLYTIVSNMEQLKERNSLGAASQLSQAVRSTQCQLSCKRGLERRCSHE